MTTTKSQDEEFEESYNELIDLCNEAAIKGYESYSEQYGQFYSVSECVKYASDRSYISLDSDPYNSRSDGGDLGNILTASAIVDKGLGIPESFHEEVVDSLSQSINFQRTEYFYDISTPVEVKYYYSSEEGLEMRYIFHPELIY